MIKHNLLLWSMIFLTMPLEAKTSRDNRKQLACCGAFVSLGLLNAGAGVVLPISHAWQVEYLSGGQGFLCGSTGFEVAHVRFFPHNSFNIFFGGGTRQEFGHHGEASSQLWGPSLGIGNDWLLDSGLSLGADWLSMESGSLVLPRFRLGFFF